MNTGGDAAEQVVRISLEGMEVALRISGSGAKNLGLIIAAILKEEHKTMGQVRLKNMIKQGRPMTVFSMQNKDLMEFTKQAKRYGVLYCVVKSKYEVSGKTMIDIIAREDDAPKINRIVQNFKLASIDVGRVMDDPGLNASGKEKLDVFPLGARPAARGPSVPDSRDTARQGVNSFPDKERESVREKLKSYSGEQKKSGFEKSNPERSQRQSSTRYKSHQNGYRQQTKGASKANYKGKGR